MRKLACYQNAARLLFLLLGLAYLFGLSACSEEATAKRTLSRVRYEEIDQFNKYNQREIKPMVYESGGRFYRVYHERTDPVVNMRRTNSLDTPFIATLNFTENLYLTKKHQEWEECNRDSHFILSNSAKREVVYAFSGGSWKKKETY